MLPLPAPVATGLLLMLCLGSSAGGGADGERTADQSALLKLDATSVETGREASHDAPVACKCIHAAVVMTTCWWCRKPRAAQQKQGTVLQASLPPQTAGRTAGEPADGRRNNGRRQEERSLEREKEEAEKPRGWAGGAKTASQSMN